MPEPAERAFRMPHRARVPPWLWLVALAIHVPLVLLLTSRRNSPPAPAFDARGLVFRDSVRTVPLPALHHIAVLPPAVAHRPAIPIAVPLVTPTVLPTKSSIAMIALVVTDTPPSRGASDLRPHYGEGRLWVQPLTESPRAIAKALSGKSDQQLTDSAVAVMIQKYLDAMAVEQEGKVMPLPSWTTKILGKTVGIDQRFVYLGPIKIPTLLLAMLLPAQKMGNISDYQANQQLTRMQSDLFDAARRAQTYADFKKAVTELHKQSEQRREFKKNQTTPPDTSHRG